MTGLSLAIYLNSLKAKKENEKMINEATFFRLFHFSLYLTCNLSTFKDSSHSVIDHFL